MPDPRPAPPVEWVSVARLGRTRGLKGEIYADGWNSPERYGWLKRVWIRNGRGELLNGGEPLEVASVRPYKGRLILRFAGVDSIGAAESFEQCEAVVPAGERPELGEGEFYVSDLAGCAVYEASTGRPVGAVTGWQDFGGALLLEVAPAGSPPGEAVWIPFTRAICVEIDPAARRIVVDPPEGLLELNRPGSSGQNAGR